MSSIFETVEDFFKKDGWVYAPLQGQPVFWSNYSGQNGQWSCLALVLEETQQFAFFSMCPVKAPADRRADLAEFITRANCDLLIGSFEMDWEGGEIRYKTSLDVEGNGLTVALVEAQIYANVAALDRYLPGLLGVLSARLSPAEALRFVETEVLTGE
jgi:hypothetical protein